MTKYIARTTQTAVMPEGCDLYDERVTRVEIKDEGGGEFVIVSQTGSVHEDNPELRIDPEEWPVLKSSIQRMIDECGKDESTEAKTK